MRQLTHPLTLTLSHRERGQKTRGSWHTVCLGLGSNVGYRGRNIVEAMRRMENLPSLRLLKLSSLYETSPIGPRQRQFLNGAALLRTTLSPARLLSVLQKIEKAMKRKKTIRWGPRIIDLDILFYDKRRLRTKTLMIPHPEFAKRKFVLRPLAEIVPSWRAPGYRQSILALSRNLRDPSQKIRRLTPALMLK